MIEQFYDLSRPLLDADERALALCREQFARLEEIKEYNQLKTLKAFTDCPRGRQPSCGYHRLRHGRRGARKAGGSVRCADGQ